MERDRTTLLLLCPILGVAAVARLWGIGFGLPHPNCRPDEGAIASIAGGLFWGDLNPHSFNYPALFPLVVAGMLRAIHAAAGILQDAGIAVSVNVLSSSMSYMTARLVSATAGTTSVWLIFRIALRLFGRDTALAAAALLALAFLHVRDSHFGVTDVPMTCMVLVAFLCIVRLSASGSTADLIAAGVAAGLATSVKYNAALIALPGAYAILAGSPGSARPFRARAPRVVLFLSLMAAAFLVSSPYSVLDFRHFFADVSHESRHLADGHGPILGRGWVFHLQSTLRYGVGLPMLTAGIVGLLLLSWRAPRKGALVGLFVLSYYMLLGSGYTVFARYMVPVVPTLCLTAGYAATEIGRWLARRIGRPDWAPSLVTLLVVSCLLPSARAVVAFDRLIARTDSRLLARRWVEARFPRGTTIAQIGPEGGHPFLQDPSEVPYIPLRLRTGETPDLVIVQSSALGPVDLSRVQDTLDADYELQFERVEATFNSANVYDWQDEFYLPLTGFKDIKRPGPNLRIYVRREAQ